MKIVADIDIDMANRGDLLEKISHIPASMQTKENDYRQHNVGVYFQNAPIDPLTGLCSIPYKEAEERGYFKVDLLNVTAYGLEKVRDENHLDELVNKEPEWDLLTFPEVSDALFHLNGHSDILAEYKPKSVVELAKTIALVRPGKRYLQGKSFDEIGEEIWEKPDDGSYYFKKAHSVAYAISIVVQMNLMMEEHEQA